MPNQGPKSPQLDGEGYLVDPSQWTREAALALAKSAGLDLSDAHWKVIEFVRHDASLKGAAPNIRRLSKVGGFPVKELYRLFPGGPGNLAAKISGYAKPQGCI